MMYEELKYGISFSVDARVELIFGMLSKLKRDNPQLLTKDKTPLEEELDFVETFDNNHFNEYAEKLYNLIKFDQFPKLRKWALILSEVPSEDIVPNVAMMIGDDFKEKQFNQEETYFKNLFTKHNYKKFINDISEFVQQGNYLEFYEHHFHEFHKMIEESTSSYPNNIDVTDIEKCYGEQMKKYPVIYSIFFNGGFGPTIDGIPTCFKGLEIDENGKYMESVSSIINLYHEYSHPFINPLVDKYWDKFEHVEEFYHYSISHNLHKAYQESPKTLYYEYYVRTMSYLLCSKYEDCSKEIEKFHRFGFVKIEEFISFINNNFKIGNNFEKFFVNDLIPFTNRITSQLIQNK